MLDREGDEMKIDLNGKLFTINIAPDADTHDQQLVEKYYAHETLSNGRTFWTHNVADLIAGEKGFQIIDRLKRIVTIAAVGVACNECQSTISPANEFISRSGMTNYSRRCAACQKSVDDAKAQRFAADESERLVREQQEMSKRLQIRNNLEALQGSRHLWIDKTWLVLVALYKQYEQSINEVYNPPITGVEDLVQEVARMTGCNKTEISNDEVYSTLKKIKADYYDIVEISGPLCLHRKSYSDAVCDKADCGCWEFTPYFTWTASAVMQEMVQAEFEQEATNAGSRV
jgi:hypothetical protein